MQKFLSAKFKLERRRQIDPITGCWLWTGNKNRGGHGIIHHDDKTMSVSRLAMHVYKDFDYDRKEPICHTRECPNAHCFNPEHLYIGTNSSNLYDAYATGNRIGWSGVRK